MWNFTSSLESMVSRTPYLNTDPNKDGFRSRYRSGERAGADFLQELRRDYGENTLIHLDIVCHSMGFAYAQGMIEVLRDANDNYHIYIKFGGYYIIAPENPSSGSVTVSEWEQLWQYGSDENNDGFFDQDGIAPQAPINGVTIDNRAFIPDDVEQGFFDSHSIGNYTWIFTLKTTQNGYVTPR